MYKNVLLVLLGFIVGIRLTEIWDYVKVQSLCESQHLVASRGGQLSSSSSSSSSSNSNDITDTHTNRKSHISASGRTGTGSGTATDTTTRTDITAATADLIAQPSMHAVTDLAAHLYNSTRVLCWVLTTPPNHEARARHVKETWGRRCHKLIFMSSREDPTLGSIRLGVREGRPYLWEKTSASLKYLYDRHFKDADWFFKTDDDTYAIMENLRMFLYPFDPATPLYFGCKFFPNVENGYMSGGAGYVLSKEALRLFAVKGYRTNYCRKNFSAEDQQLGRCLQNIGVTAGDSRDELGRERFLPLSPKFLMPVISKNWLPKYLFYNHNDKDFCCSHTAISFHYTKAHEFDIFEYFLYGLKPFGLPQPKISLPERLNATEMQKLVEKWRTDRSNNKFGTMDKIQDPKVLTNGTQL